MRFFMICVVGLLLLPSTFATFPLTLGGPATIAGPDCYGSGYATIDIFPYNPLPTQGTLPTSHQPAYVTATGPGDCSGGWEIRAEPSGNRYLLYAKLSPITIAPSPWGVLAPNADGTWDMSVRPVQSMWISGSAFTQYNRSDVVWDTLREVDVPALVWE